MFKFRNYKRTTVCFVILILTLVVSIAVCNAGTTQNVNVMNTPSVNVSNTPNVNVTNKPNVNIANTSSIPVQVKTQEPYLGNIFGISIGDNVCHLVEVGPQISAGKRLVIEYFSCTMGSGAAGQAYVFEIRAGAGSDPQAGYGGVASLPVTPAALEGGNRDVSAGQSIRLYVDGGLYPQIRIARSGGCSGISNGECHYVGYLEDVP